MSSRVEFSDSCAIVAQESRMIPATAIDPGSHPFRPPAPAPQPQALGLVGLLSALKRNPLECWTQEHFEKLIVPGGLPIGHVLLVNDPEAIRHVLLDNAANYQKDSLQRRILSAGLGEGLLSAEGERWQIQRRMLAP